MGPSPRKSVSEINTKLGILETRIEISIGMSLETSELKLPATIVAGMQEDF